MSLMRRPQQEGQTDLVLHEKVRHEAKEEPMT
jgi:hypothetical protein